jgi:hypothetical protein
MLILLLVVLYSLLITRIQYDRMDFLLKHFEGKYVPRSAISSQIPLQLGSFHLWKEIRAERHRETSSSGFLWMLQDEGNERHTDLQLSFDA